MEGDTEYFSLCGDSDSGTDVEVTARREDTLSMPVWKLTSDRHVASSGIAGVKEDSRIDVESTSGIDIVATAGVEEETVYIAGVGFLRLGVVVSFRLALAQSGEDECNHKRVTDSVLQEVDSLTEIESASLIMELMSSEVMFDKEMMDTKEELELKGDDTPPC